MILKQLKTTDAVQLFGVQKALLGIVFNVGCFMYMVTHIG